MASWTLRQLDANTAAPSSITQAIPTRMPSSTSASPVLTPTSSAPSNYNNNGPYDYNSSAFTTSWITYLAIIVVAGVLVALLSSRYFYIRRYYPRPTLRAYFLPRNGIHLSWLRIHVQGAPNRTLQPTMTTLQQVYAHSGTSGSSNINNHGIGDRRRRRRRNRQTVGETLGPGGTRIGDGDLDDGWDYDDIDLEERGVGGLGGTRGELPQYQADSGLPAYIAPPGTLIQAAVPSTTTTRASELAPGSGGGGDEVLPTAAEYEALSRGNRDGTIIGSHLPIYPPPVHVHGTMLSASVYPSEPPPSFSRANSTFSTRTRRSVARHEDLVNTHDLVSSTNNAHHGLPNDSRSTFETPTDDAAGEHDGRMRRHDEVDQGEDRRESTTTATSSSSTSKLDDGEGDDDDDRSSIKSRRRDNPVASSSKLTLGSSSSASTAEDEKNGPNEGKMQGDVTRNKEQ